MAERASLPSVEMINWKGLYTKQNPEVLEPTMLRECKNADFFREYGSLSKIRGNLRVLNAQYTESSVAQPISWGGFYKTQDLDGAIIRDELIAAGTTIRRVEDDGTTTELLANEPNGLFRTHANLDRFMFITSQNPFSVGDRGQMSKYDGTRITQWGVTPPGENVTVPILTSPLASPSTDSFGDSTLFTTSPNSPSNATVADSTQPAFKGTSTAMTKGTSSTSAHIEDLNRSPEAINNIIADRIRMSVYIPRADFRKLATSGRCLSVYFGSDSTLASNYYRYDYQVGRLFEGWNTLIFDFSTIPSGDFGTRVGTPDDDNIASFRCEILTNNASDTPTIYWDNLGYLDQGGAIPTFGAAGGSIFPQSAFGTWKLRVTFIDEVGNESNSGPTSVTADNTSGSVDFGQVTWDDIPVSPNPAVVRRDLYRTTAGGASYLFLATLNDNSQTSYVDTIADTSLGITTPPILGDAIFDNSPPPASGISMIWKRTAFLAGDPLNPNFLYYSRYDLPEAFPFANAVEFDERITGLFNTAQALIVVTETSYWRILGDNPDFTIDKVIEGFGGVGPRATGIARGIGWIVDRDGMRLYDLRETIKVSEVMRDRVDAFDKTQIEQTNTAHSKANNCILWLAKDSDGIYSNIYNFQYAIDEIRTGWYTQIVPNPATFDIQSVWEIEDSSGDFHFHVGTSAGMVFEIFAANSLNWLDESGSSRPITMELQTPYIRLGDAGVNHNTDATNVSGRVSPRWIEFRAKEENGLAHTWTITVDTADSAAENVTPRDTADITFAFPAGVSLLRLSLADLTPAEYMRLTIKNEEKDVDVSIMGVKVEFNVRPGQFAVTGAQVTGAGQN